LTRWKEAALDNVARNLALNGCVRQRRVGPKIAVVLHGFGCGDEALHHLSDIGFSVVQAEDNATGANPAQRDAVRAQVVLQQPVVARGL
jgi:hypothetical protein